MRRFTSLEWAILILGIVCLLAGVYAFINPKAALIYFAPTRSRGGISFPASVQHVTPGGARVYGMLAMVLGALLLMMALAGKKDKSS